MTRRFVAEPFGNDQRRCVLDSGRGVVRIFAPWIDGDDCKALAEAEADRLEAEHGPQWVPAGTGCLERVTLRHRATGIEVTVASNEADSLLAWLNSPEGWKP